MEKIDWADAGDENALPPRTETGPDENGVKTIVEWKLVDGKKMQTTIKTKEKTVKMKVNKNVEERKKWEKFGEEKQQRSFESGEAKVTTVTQVSNEDIFVEVPEGGAVPKKKKEEGQIVNFDSFFARLEARKRGEITDAPKAADKKPATSSDAPTKYVPPRAREGANREGGTSMRSRDDGFALRVTNLSNEVTREDLDLLFGRFGTIERIHLVRDRVTGESRGFGFINFKSKKDAEKAMEALNGYGFDSLIISVDWAKPSTPS